MFVASVDETVKVGPDTVVTKAESMAEHCPNVAVVVYMVDPDGGVNATPSVMPLFHVITAISGLVAIKVTCDPSQIV